MELTELKARADLWWRERSGLWQGLFKNPLFLALGARLTQPDEHSVVLRLPWKTPQRLLASEVPMAVLMGAAEMALQVHLRQLQVFAPLQFRVKAGEIHLTQSLDQSVEFRLKSDWAEWEELRLQLARSVQLEKTYTLPIWGSDGRTLGTVQLHTELQSQRLLGTN